MPDTDRESPPTNWVEAALELWSQGAEELALPVTGRSMLPILRPGDLVHIQRYTRALQTGEFITFHLGDQLFTHRLLAIQGEGQAAVFLTKGDYAIQRDPFLREGDILGRVAAVERGDRLMRLDTPAWQRCGGWIARWMLLSSTPHSSDVPGFLTRIKNKILLAMSYLVISILLRLMGC